MMSVVRVERARYFLAAVETGSLRAAAARCGVSQPSIGEQVALLEEELDVVLLTRTRRGVRPTPAGQDLLEPLRRLVAAEDDVRAGAAESGGSYRGTVSIGAISVVAETVVAPVVGRLREHHPGLRFTVEESSSSDIEDKVIRGDLDFGVITMWSEQGSTRLRRDRLFTTPVGALVPADHPLAQRKNLRWADLETWPIVSMRPGTVLAERLSAGLPGADVVASAMSARSVKLLVAHGAGVGILSPVETSADIAGLTWVPLRDAEPLHIGLVQRRDARPSPSALVVRRLIQEQATEDLRGATHLTSS